MEICIFVMQILHHICILCRKCNLFQLAFSICRYLLLYLVFQLQLLLPQIVSDLQKKNFYHLNSLVHKNILSFFLPLIKKLQFHNIYLFHSFLDYLSTIWKINFIQFCKSCIFKGPINCFFHIIYRVNYSNSKK